MISGISNIQGYAGLNEITTEHAAAAHQHPKTADKDSINLNPALTMTDEEAEQTMQEVSQEIRAGSSEALAAHQGLDYNRVMALLGEI